MLRVVPETGSTSLHLRLHPRATPIKPNTSQNIVIHRANDYLGRVVRHDAVKKGVSAFIASALYALVVEAAFPTKAA